jgi:hypothetical protein
LRGVCSHVGAIVLPFAAVSIDRRGHASKRIGRGSKTRGPTRVTPGACHATNTRCHGRCLEIHWSCAHVCGGNRSVDTQSRKWR